MSRNTMISFATLFAFVATTMASPSNDFTFRLPLNAKSSRRSIQKRDTLPVALNQSFTPDSLYSVNVSIGSPPQSVTLAIDTGAANIWAISPEGCPKISKNNATPLQDCGGTYNISQSDTHPESVGDFAEGYGFTGDDETLGVYVRDVLSIGPWQLQNYTIGVANQGNSVPAGFGLARDEVLLQPETASPGLLTSLRNAGYIKSRSFSLWLDDEEGEQGTLMFGGYDTSKFESQDGKLDMIPIQKNASGQYDYYYVALTSIAATLASESGNKSYDLTPQTQPFIVNLDAGTSSTGVPQDVFDQIAALLGVQHDDEYGYVVNCQQALQGGSIDFQFAGDDGPVVAVPLSELIHVGFTGRIEDGLLESLYNDQQEPLCQFGLDRISDADIAAGHMILGHSFLRSAYVYFDIDSNEIGIGQTRFSSESQIASHVVEVDANEPLPSDLVEGTTSLRVSWSSVASTPTPSSTGDGSIFTNAPTTGLNTSAIKGSPTSFSASFPTAAGNPLELIEALNATSGLPSSLVTPTGGAQQPNGTSYVPPTSPPTAAPKPSAGSQAPSNGAGTSNRIPPMAWLSMLVAMFVGRMFI